MSRISTSAKVLAMAAGLIASPALAAGVPMNDAQLNATSAGSSFSITNRISDQSGVAPLTDPALVNAWGLSQGPGTFLWVSNNGSDTSTFYDPSTFAKFPLNVSVPGGPTGTTFIGVTDAFNVSEGGKMGNTLFAFATEGGQIEGWNPNVDLHNAVVAFDGSAHGAEFKGLTLGAAFTVENENRQVSFPGFDHIMGRTFTVTVPVLAERPVLFAADFGNNRIDAFNSNFQLVKTFTDPLLPAGYTPFNVQTLNDQLYVTFARRAPGAHDEDHGPGLGIVDVFNPNGVLVHRLVTGGPLNAPWGLMIAPPSFGKFAGALLVGNFGDGKINAFNPATGQFLGQLDDGAPGGGIDGLWALHSGPNGTITFSAGPQDESHGLIGSIAPVGPMWGHQEVASMAEMHR